MRHLQRLPVLVRNEGGLDEEAIERPQRQGERQQRRGSGRTCGGEAVPSRAPRGPPPAPPGPARPRLPAPRCAEAPPAEPYSTDRRLRSRTASGIAPPAPRPPPSAGACAAAGAGQRRHFRPVPVASGRPGSGLCAVPRSGEGARAAAVPGPLPPRAPRVSAIRQRRLPPCGAGCRCSTWPWPWRSAWPAASTSTGRSSSRPLPRTAPPAPARRHRTPRPRRGPEGVVAASQPGPRTAPSAGGDGAAPSRRCRHLPGPSRQSRPPAGAAAACLCASYRTLGLEC